MANVRKAYTIRTSLGEGMLDLVVNPTSSNSTFQFKREFTVRTIIFSLLDMLFIFWMFSSTFLGTGGLIGMPLFFFGYIWISYLMIRPSNTKLLGYTYLLPILNYLDPGYRNVSTRSVAPAAPFMGICDVKGTLKDGRIIYNNNDIGVIIELVGTASVLMFDADQRAVINSVGNFYRKIKPGLTLTYDNVFAPQRVLSQLKAKQDQLDRLRLFKGSKQLQDLVKTQRLILSDYVGKQYKSLHQFMVVRATNQTNLDNFLEWMQSQVSVNHSSAYLRDYRILTNKDEIEEYLRNLYTSNDLHIDDLALSKVKK